MNKKETKMIPTYNELQNLLNTLPVGYYIGRNVPLTLTNENGSYYLPMKDEAYISYPMMYDVLHKIENKLTSENIETLLRTITYHEIAHAFITPKKLFVNDVINIFEDERIESICRNYFKQTDFKQLLMLVNDWDGVSPAKNDDPITKWYSLIRYHIGPKEFLDKATELIYQYRFLNRNADSYDTRKYQDAVHNLFIDFTQANDQSTPANVNQNESLCSGKGDTNYNDSFELTNNEVKEIFTLAQPFANADIQEKIANIISANKKVTKSNASAINAYSGVFNPRSVIRDDYKWFVQQNRQGNVKQYSKIKLNLFIDNSGSFWLNETIVNQILFALAKLEKVNSNFSFDLVTMNTSFSLKSKDCRQISCEGANNIPDDAKQIIDKVQDKQTMNYNIVLFDGYAFSGQRNGNHKNFGFFNIPNTVMIIESSNKELADTYCKNTRRICSTNYPEELFKQICIALNFLLK
jgi:hypothetical protein